jgi:hypothetical protein
MAIPPENERELRFQAVVVSIFIGRQPVALTPPCYCPMRDQASKPPDDEGGVKATALQGGCAAGTTAICQ